eukprot:364693-Chlamydomonas_euryale.AAC.11
MSHGIVGTRALKVMSHGIVGTRVLEVLSHDIVGTRECPCSWTLPVEGLSTPDVWWDHAFWWCLVVTAVARALGRATAHWASSGTRSCCVLLRAVVVACCCALLCAPVPHVHAAAWQAMCAAAMFAIGEAIRRVWKDAPQQPPPGRPDHKKTASPASVGRGGVTPPYTGG